MAAILHLFSVGDVLYAGAHDVDVCLEKDGCYVVTVTEVWNHENFEYLPGRIPNEDIAVLK